jgi:radical SAM superfamily enzyme YgiQ (UPF0313 family)
MKIVFIEPKSPNLHIFSYFGLPRLGCVLLGTIARGLGHDVQVFVEEIAQIDWKVVRRADLVGISTISSTAPRAYAMADRVRRMGIRVVMGGPHVTTLAEEAGRHCDFVLLGEAEETFPQLLEHIEGRRRREDVQGLVYLEDRRILRTAPPEKRVDIDNSPAPDFSLIKGFHGAGSFVSGRVIPVQVSRGCPHDCSFCSVTGIFGRKMRYRSVKNVMAELARYNDRKYHVFFYDDNFTASPARAKELLTEMLEARTKFTWSTQMRVDAARDKHLLELMRATHCIAVYVGVESPSPAALKEADKRQDPGEMKEMLLRFRRFGICVHGMFVIGFDADGPDCWKAVVDFARSADIATIQACILTPLPGTRVFKEMDAAGRIMFKDWSLYDSHHVVFRHPVMDPEQLQRCQLNAHSAFYSGRKILKDITRGDIGNVMVALYARSIQYRWGRQNSIYMKAIKLLKPWRELEVRMDLRLPAAVE